MVKGLRLKQGPARPMMQFFSFKKPLNFLILRSQISAMLVRTFCIATSHDALGPEKYP